MEGLKTQILQIKTDIKLQVLNPALECLLGD